MTMPAPARSLSPELRTTFFYLTMFLGSGAAAVYLPIWLAEKGMSPEQIGVVNAVPIFLILVLNLFVGRIADKAGDWRQVIVGCALVSGVAPLALFFVDDFWGILLVWTLLSLPSGAMGPVVDAAAVRLTRRNGTDFGVIRAWGTVGYMVMNALTGFVAAWGGSAVFVPLFAGVLLLRGVLSLQLPRFRAPDHQPTVAAIAPAARLRAALQPWFVLPLIGFGMVFGTHYILNAFAALLWKAQGIDEAVIGPLVALGALSEAAMMFAWRRVGARFSPRYVILVSALVSGLRWIAMAFSPPVLVLVGLQALHGVTFAMGFLACVHFIAKWTSEDIAAETQSLFAGLQQVMSVVALVGFGWLVTLMGEKAYLVAALFALVAGGLVVVSLRLRSAGS